MQKLIIILSLLSLLIINTNSFKFINNRYTIINKLYSEKENLNKDDMQVPDLVDGLFKGEVDIKEIEQKLVSKEKVIVQKRKAIETELETASIIGTSFTGLFIGGISDGAIANGDAPYLPIIGGALFAGAAYYAITQGKGTGVDNFIVSTFGKLTLSVRDSALKLIKESIDNAKKALNDKVEDTIEEIQAIPSNVKKSINKKVEDTVEEIQAIPSKLAKSIEKKIESTVKDIQNIPNYLSDAAADTAEAAKKAATKKADDIVTDIKNIPNKVADVASKSVESVTADVSKKVSSAIKVPDIPLPSLPSIPSFPESKEEEKISPAVATKPVANVEAPKVKAPEAPKVNAPKAGSIINPYAQKAPIKAEIKSSPFPIKTEIKSSPVPTKVDIKPTKKEDDLPPLFSFFTSQKEESKPKVSPPTPKPAPVTTSKSAPVNTVSTPIKKEETKSPFSFFGSSSSSSAAAPKSNVVKPAPVAAKPAPVVASKPAPVVASKPAPVVASKPAPVIVSKPAAVVAAKPTEPIKPVVQVNLPKTGSVVNPYAQSKSTTTTKPVVTPSPQPVVKPTPQPIVKSTPQPVVKPTPQPVVKPTPQPVVKPTPQPVVKPTPQPVVKPTPIAPASSKLLSASAIKTLNTIGQADKAAAVDSLVGSYVSGGKGGPEGLYKDLIRTLGSKDNAVAILPDIVGSLPRGDKKSALFTYYQQI